MNRHLRFLTVTTALAVALLGAGPAAVAVDPRDPDDMTVAEATRIGNMEPYLCDKRVNQAEYPVPNGVSLFDRCTNVMGDPSAKISDVKKQMGMPNAVFVYCQASPGTAVGGLIGLPRACVPAESVL